MKPSNEFNIQLLNYYFLHLCLKFDNDSSSSIQFRILHSSYPHQACFTIGKKNVYTYIIESLLQSEYNRATITVKSRAVYRSTIKFLTIFGVLLTKMCYYLRCATIAMSSNQSTDELHEFISIFVNHMTFSIFEN